MQEQKKSMKNNFMQLLISFLIISCLTLNNLKYEVKSDGSQNIYVGEVNRKIIQSDTNFTWFDKNYKSYSPNKEAIEILKSKKDKIDFLIFAGTWCGDTKRELPKFYKLVDEVGISEKNIQLICVDRSKKSLDSLTFKYDLRRIPTIIILQNNKEVGRFVESPQLSLEDDLAKIVIDLK